jgi:hypothetical protein
MKAGAQNAGGKMFNVTDAYVYRRIMRWFSRRGGWRTAFRAKYWPSERLHGIGLVRLMGSVRYPTQATLVRPSLSRVREIRKHGLKGGAGMVSACGILSQ